MEKTIVHSKIMEIVQGYLPGSQIVLFGSRARGEQDHHSDYDLLIITPMTFTQKEKIYWANQLDRAIVKALNAPVDLLLNSEEEIREKQQLSGHIVRTALREGVPL